MSDGEIHKLLMPKWGMSMTEGKFAGWLVAESMTVTVGDELAEVETEKINGVVESTATGTLRRHVAVPDEVVPVGGLLGVIADASVSDADIDAFIESVQASFVPGEEADNEPQPETVDLGGRAIRYLKQGDGQEAIVLLHGYGGDLENWMFIQSSLAIGRRVYALDLPGHGGSSKDVGDGGVDEFAAVVTEFIEQVGGAPAHLVGHSMGGAVAMAVSLTRPDQVASLTLIASAGFGADINASYIDGFRSAQSRRELKPYLELLFADPSLVTRQLMENVLRYKRLDGVDEALRIIGDRMFTGGRQQRVLVPEFGRLPVPILVIWGTADHIIPPEHLGAAPAQAQTIMLEGAGHSPHIEKANEVIRLINRFIEGDAN